VANNRNEKGIKLIVNDMNKWITNETWTAAWPLIWLYICYSVCLCYAYGIMVLYGIEWEMGQDKWKWTDLNETSIDAAIINIIYDGNRNRTTWNDVGIQAIDQIRQGIERTDGNEEFMNHGTINHNDNDNEEKDGGG
jgi:hypothetical protein